MWYRAHLWGVNDVQSCFCLSTFLCDFLGFPKINDLAETISHVSWLIYLLLLMIMGQ
jgi:hypothetical protein